MNNKEVKNDKFIKYNFKNMIAVILFPTLFYYLKSRNASKIKFITLIISIVCLTIVQVLYLDKISVNIATTILAVIAGTLVFYMGNYESSKYLRYYIIFSLILYYCIFLIKSNQYKFIENSIEIIISIVFFVYFGISRIIHFIYVFVIKDIFLDEIYRKNKEDVDKDRLGKYRSIKLILLSYLSLILEYSVLYYILDKSCILSATFGDFMFGTKHFTNIYDAILYSTSIITTASYRIEGERLMILAFNSIQILSGMWLLIISLGKRNNLLSNDDHN